MEYRGTQIVKTISKKNKTRGLILSDFIKITAKVRLSRQTDRGIEQRAQTQPLHVWFNDFQQECQDHSVAKEQCSQHMVLGKWDIHTQKNEVRTLPGTVYKN